MACTEHVGELVAESVPRCVAADEAEGTGGLAIILVGAERLILRLVHIFSQSNITTQTISEG